MPSIEPFRFVHTGDLHLDSPFEGITTSAPAPVVALLRSATIRAWQNVVRTALAERVDFLLVAGDVFERTSPTLLGQTRFRDGLAELAEAGIASFVVHGNHDPLDGKSWSASLEFPALSHRFGTRLGSAPALRDGREICRIYGQSYARAATTENLAASFRRDAGAPFAIGLLHANVGDRPGHGNYAPCSIDDLRVSGMDYWALGHIHKPGVLSAADPLAVYCGNPQGRDAGETGPRGAWLVDVDAAARPAARFIACDVVRWEQIDVDIGLAGDDDELGRVILDACGRAAEEADGRSLVVRVRLTGRSPLHSHLARPGYLEDRRSLLNEQLPLAEPLVWIESIVDQTRPEIDLEARRRAQDFVGDFLRVTDTARRAAISTDPATYERWQGRLRGAVAPLYDAPRARRYLAAHRPDDDALSGELLDAAETLALDLLVAGEEDR